MEIGTLIRAFDFPSTDSCYMEGRVVDIDTERNLLTVRTTDKVFGGEKVEFGEFFKTPILGTAFSDGMTRYNEDKGVSRYQSRIIFVGL